MDTVSDMDTAQAVNTARVDERQEVEAAAPRGEQIIDIAPETPILSAMLAGWNGPAASLVEQCLARAEAAPGPAAAARSAVETERPNPIRIRVSGNGRAPLVTASGELSEDTADQVAAPVQLCLLTRPRQVSIDLSGITTVTPGAVTTLLGLREAAYASDSTIELRAVSRPVREILERTGTYETLRPRRPEPPESAAPAPMDPDMLEVDSLGVAAVDAAPMEAAALDDETAGAKPTCSAERQPKGHRRASRLRRPPQVV